MMDIKEVLLQWFKTSLIKKLLVAVLRIENIPDQQLAKELHKPIIRKFKKRKVQSPFIDNIWGSDFAN